MSHSGMAQRERKVEEGAEMILSEDERYALLVRAKLRTPEAGGRFHLCIVCGQPTTNTWWCAGRRRQCDPPRKKGGLVDIPSSMPSYAFTPEEVRALGGTQESEDGF